MRSKRSREADQASLDVSASSHDDHILREAANLAATSDFSGSIPTSPSTARRRRIAEDENDILDRFSLRIVSSLQGSTTLGEAQATARQVLSELIKPLEDEVSENRARADKFSAANKVLGRALLIMRDKLGIAQREAADAEERVKQVEERLRQSEQAVNVLRWHLQNDRPAGGIHTPPDIF